MKYLKTAVMFSLVLLLAGIQFPQASAQQGPQSQPSETVAKPRKKDVPAETPADEPKIPSQYKKDKEVPANLPTFRSDVTAVQVEVAVLDNKGHFIPNIPRGNFRVLEDNVPQQITTFSTNSRCAHDHRHGDRIQRPLPAILEPGLVRDPDRILWLRPNPEAGRLRRHHRVRHAAGDPLRLHHGPHEDPGSHATFAHSGIFGIEHVRRGGGHRPAHEQHRRTQGHSADRNRPRHFQQTDLRQSPQGHPGRRGPHIRHQHAAGPAHHGGSIHGPPVTHGLSCRPTTK